MKRTWEYIGSMLPLTVGMALATRDALADFEASQADSIQQGSVARGDEHEASPDPGTSPAANGAVDVDAATSPGTVHSGEGSSPSSSEAGGSSGNQLGSVAGQGGISPDMYADAGMFAPISGSHTAVIPMDGGGSASKIASGKAVETGRVGSSGGEPSQLEGDGAGSGGVLASGDNTDTPGTALTINDSEAIYDPVVRDPVSREADLSDDDSMLIMLTGSAASYGVGGSTSGDVDIDVVDYGSITVAYGSAVFTSSYAGEASEDAWADASTTLDVFGADLVFSYSLDYDYGFTFGDYAEHTDVSQTHFIAIDFEEPSGDEQGFSYASSMLHDGFLSGLPVEFYRALDRDGDAVSIDGNAADLTFNAVGADGNEPVGLQGSVASSEDSLSAVDLDAQLDGSDLSVSASAAGVDTLSSVDGALLVFEDEYSSISSTVIIGA